MIFYEKRSMYMKKWVRFFIGVLVCVQFFIAARGDIGAGGGPNCPNGSVPCVHCNTCDCVGPCSGCGICGSSACSCGECTGDDGELTCCCGCDDDMCSYGNNGAGCGMCVFHCDCDNDKCECCSMTGGDYNGVCGCREVCPGCSPTCKEHCECANDKCPCCETTFGNYNGTCGCGEKCQHHDPKCKEHCKCLKSISITGSENANDGQMLTYTCVPTPSDAEITVEWELDPEGGGVGLETPTVSSSEKTADVTFFWHAGNGNESQTCTYSLKCKATDNQSGEEKENDKTVTLNMPVIAGRAYVDFACRTDSYASGGFAYITGVISSSSEFGLDVYLPVTSQFYGKAYCHESKHCLDYGGGRGSEAAIEGNTYGSNYIDENNMGGPLTWLEEVLNDLEICDAVKCYMLDRSVTSWAETRAYGISNGIEPMGYLYEH